METCLTSSDNGRIILWSIKASLPTAWPTSKMYANSLKLQLRVTYSHLIFICKLSSTFPKVHAHHLCTSVPTPPPLFMGFYGAHLGPIRIRPYFCLFGELADQFMKQKTKYGLVQIMALCLRTACLRGRPLEWLSGPAQSLSHWYHPSALDSTYDSHISQSILQNMA